MHRVGESPGRGPRLFRAKRNYRYMYTQTYIHTYIHRYNMHERRFHTCTRFLIFVLEIWHHRSCVAWTWSKATFYITIHRSKHCPRHLHVTCHRYEVAPPPKKYTHITSMQYIRAESYNAHTRSILVVQFFHHQSCVAWTWSKATRNLPALGRQ